jgi:hypothetical protein
MFFSISTLWIGEMAGGRGDRIKGVYKKSESQS